MVLWWLFAIAVFLFALNLRESYTDPESPVNPPVLTSSGQIPSDWQSKIDAISPIGGDDMTYFKAVQAFYRTVYVPAATKPKDSDVEAFLKTPAATAVGIDPVTLRRLLATSFRVELTTTSAEREKRELVTTGALAGFTGSNLQPGNARDEVYTRVEDPYVPTDTEQSDRAAEGVYTETTQTTPLRTFESGTPFASANLS
jgi:hypothetical protein